jgi:hypothetical protein
MVFVHARKETVKSALALREAANMDGILEEFSCQEHPSFEFFRRDISASRNKEMKQLFDDGFGIHHAGMLRSDRNMMERMFEAKAIKVLCCTATLAWGVNLPAHAGRCSYVLSVAPLSEIRQLLSRERKCTTAPRAPSSTSRFSMCCKSSVALDGLALKPVERATFARPKTSWSIILTQ